MSDVWYLDADDYYVREQRDTYPLCQGDLIEGFEIDGERWWAGQVVHPTCELTKSTVREVQVVRVRPVSDLSEDLLKSLVVSGFREIEGHRRVAVAHTFFLPPWDATGEPCFADFRSIVKRPRERVTVSGRLAPITHECRVTFIRRWLYFRFRLLFSTEQVRAWEGSRIRDDPAFSGPKPGWATQA